MNVRELRLRRLNNMSITSLEELNGRLVGRGEQWATPERHDVCAVLGSKLAFFLTDNNQWYLTD